MPMLKKTASRTQNAVKAMALRIFISLLRGLKTQASNTSNRTTETLKTIQSAGDDVVTLYLQDQRDRFCRRFYALNGCRKWPCPAPPISSCHKWSDKRRKPQPRPPFQPRSFLNIRSRL